MKTNFDHLKTIRKPTLPGPRVHGGRKNRLEQWIEDEWRDEARTMNELQDRGIVSDEAVLAADVCDFDAEKAIAMLT